MPGSTGRKEGEEAVTHQRGKRAGKEAAPKENRLGAAQVAPSFLKCPGPA